MTKLIEKNDPRYFSQTSDLPYDRHHYKIVHKDRSIMVESWVKSKSGGGIIVDYQHLMQLCMFLINQNQKQKVLNEFISRRKNHRVGVDYLCILCYTTHINTLWCYDARCSRFNLYACLLYTSPSPRDS